MTKVISTLWQQTISGPKPPSAPVRLRDTRVAREAELAEIERTLRSGRSLLVFGPVGVGKTHLVDSFASSDAFYDAVPEPPFGHRARTANPGAPVWVSVGAARDRSLTPLGALLDVLPDVAVDVAAPIGTVRALVLDGLRAMSAGRSLVVRVDDAHLLDDLSARVLSGLARQDELQIVATLREFVAGRSPWFELWKDGVADRLDLQPFSRAQVEGWLSGSLGGSIASEALHQVWDASVGNAFQMLEVTASAVRSGALRRDSDVWVWSGEAPLSRRVIELVKHEVAHVGAQGRRALELVAVARGLDRDVLERIVPAPVIDGLLAEGVLSVRYRDTARDVRPDTASSSEPVVRLPHLQCSPMVAEVLLEMASAGQRREILATLRAVQGDLGTQTGLALVASVAASLECGLPETPARIVAALHTSLMAGRCPEVKRMASAALSMLPLGTPARLDVLAARAQAWRFLDQPARSLRDIDQLREEMAATEVDSETYVRHIIATTEIVMAIEQYHHGDTESALRALGIAEVQVDARLQGNVPAETALQLTVARLVALSCAGRFHECRGEATAIASGPDSLSVHVLPLIPIMIVDLCETGRLFQAQELVQKHLGVAVAHADTRPWAVAEILSAGFLALIGLGEVAAAEGVVAMLSGDGAPFNVERTSGHLIRGGLATLRGRWSDARAELHAANVQFAISDVIGLSAMTLVSEGLMAIASGDTAAGRELLSRADAAPSRMYSAYMQAEIRCLHLDAAAWLRAPDLYDQGLGLAEWAAERGLWRVELDGLHRAVFALHGEGRLAAGGDLLERVHAVAAHIDGRRARAQLAHVVAMFSCDRDLILVASRELGESGVWLPLSQPPVALTRREQEIAGLAAGGLSSKEIAERLVLSVRTVDSHLSRIFAKAGVRSRRELASVLHVQAPSAALGR
ncbi:regulatory protein, luxR family [Sanguibacter gelidistatuariae]|uniref:Regulatory protein, luxR family n=1 Tax=Sanguibacter gelidistatuariae TaxID=1814289 RepID=A0A1G6MZV1_9MICO|nr:LuxR family transcriptional regulator [Sanguibacter gelidistatuariae]SDC60415.1 regulatory protein, luxR family [Sanguibacter gelidistatuariae]